ncbi:MAG: APC family permease [Terriglobales bacterium]
MATPSARGNAPQLVRGIGVRGGVALNMINMIGVGPFITLPLILAAMGGPQAMLGWILGGVFALCDGLIWAELGATFPEAGGSYRYLAECYGPKWGRLLSFLFVWQLSFSAPLSIASGCIGLALYSSFLFPALTHPLLTQGSAALGISLSGVTAVAVGVCLLALWLAYRRVGNINRISQYLWVGVLATVAWVIFAALTHFHASLAFAFPPHAFAFSGSFFLGLGSAMLIATYDYWGYYNVGFLGGEMEQPEKNIPRAIIWSVILVAIIYIVMNIGVVGVMPWQELTRGLAHNYVMSEFMQRLYGGWAGGIVTALIIWTAFASVFALMLGYSRVPYAAALDGNYFKSFAKLHPRGQFPYVSLLWIGGVAALFCCFSLEAVIAALVVIRISLQFLLQAIGLLVLRARRPELTRPFRMRWYPLPVLVAIAGFVYVLFSRTQGMVQLRYAGLIAVVGVIIYLTRLRRRASSE